MLTIFIVIVGGLFGMLADHNHWIEHPSLFYLLGFIVGQLSMLLRKSWVR